MGFFIISEVVLEKLKNLKNSCLQKGGLKTEQNPFFFVNLGLYYSATGYFHINFFKKCYTITADMILIHLELFSKGLGPNRA